MTISGKLFVELFSLSGCFWILLYLYANLQIKGFIVKRYKEETDLTRTLFFTAHVPFVLYLPDFFSAGFFGTHLMMCVWGWRFFGNRKVFRDIENPNIVIRHFSVKEIRRVKWVLMSGFILFVHGVAYFILRFIWTEMFK